MPLLKDAEFLIDLLQKVNILFDFIGFCRKLEFSVSQFSAS